MKKRILAGVLLVLLCLSCLLPVSRAGENLYFVAVNDTVPLDLPGGEAPFYQNGTLYVARTAFGAGGLGVTPSYNAENQTMALFSRNQRLVFHLDTGEVLDENNQKHGAGAIMRGGMLYLPALVCAGHFGLSVSYLTNSSGYRILRFTNGAQVYDDSLFLEKSSNLIAYRVEQRQPEQTKPESPKPTTPTEPPKTPTTPTEPPKTPTASTEEPKPEKKPPTVYLAIEGAGSMGSGLTALSRHKLRAVCFLTETEIRDNAKLVCRILAEGGTVGLTASSDEQDPAAALAAANEALRALTGRKTLLALLTNRQKKQVTGYCVFLRDRAISAAKAAEQDGGSHLVLLRSGVEDAYQTLSKVKTVFRPLRETSPV